MSYSFIQPLEGRLLLSVSWPNTVNRGDRSVFLRNGVLTIHGGSGKDHITFTASFTSGSVFPNITDADSQLVVHINRKAASFSFNQIKSIKIDGGDGDDRIEMQSEPSFGCWLFGNGNLGGFIPFGWQDRPTLIFGGAGNDTIVGGDLDDTIYAGSGDDSVFGMLGDDRIFGMAGKDDLSGDDGDDHLDGGAGADTLWGFGGSDTLLGRAGSDYLDGETGDDQLFGGSGGDGLWGGEGVDVAHGGSGRDGANSIEHPRDTVEVALPDPFEGTTCV